MNLWTLLQAGLLTTTLDVDNALYLTSAIEDFPKKEQQKAILIGLLIEFLGRLVLIAIFLWVFGGRDVTFTVAGITFSPESIALIGAGIFLFWRSLHELLDFFRGKQSEGETSITIDQSASFGRRMLEISLVNITLSIDTIVAITGSTSEGWQILYLLLFSAVIRAVFVRQIAVIIHRLPSLNIIILTFLTMIGVTLFLEGLGLAFPQEAFNLILLTAVITAVLYERRRQRLTRLLAKWRHEG